MWLSNLRRIKAESGKTTKQIAELSGVPEPTLEKLFSGTTKEPKLETVWAVVKALGHSLDDLDDRSSEQKERAQDEEHPEPRITVDGLAEMLERAGFIKPGEDLTDSDFRYLASIIASLSTWFDQR